MYKTRKYNTFYTFSQFVIELLIKWIQIMVYIIYSFFRNSQSFKYQMTNEKCVIITLNESIIFLLKINTVFYVQFVAVSKKKMDFILIDAILHNSYLFLTREFKQ